jgi:hypothetical protein
LKPTFAAATAIQLSAPLPREARELRVTYDTSQHIGGFPAVVRIESR